NAIRLLMGILSLIIVFHVLILLKVIPFDIAWGGRLKSEKEMYIFESVSIVLNLLLLWLIALKAKDLKRKAIDIILWIFVGLFSLNTVGNLLAQTTFEKYFSIVTLLLALLLLRILVVKK
ncbi:MAG: hypothetical protein KDC44_23815, partial [Phaeodactylibacter sp.]|nr:hypothetical protein [Phaeodactylibacter sp.]